MIPGCTMIVFWGGKNWELCECCKESKRKKRRWKVGKTKKEERSEKKRGKEKEWREREGGAVGCFRYLGVEGWVKSASQGCVCVRKRVSVWGGKKRKLEGLGSQLHRSDCQSMGFSSCYAQWWGNQASWASKRGATEPQCEFISTVHDSLSAYNIVTMGQTVCCYGASGTD